MAIRELEDYDLKRLYRDLIGEDSFEDYKSVQFLYSGLENTVKIELPEKYDDCVSVVLNECAKRFCKTLLNDN